MAEGCDLTGTAAYWGMSGRQVLGVFEMLYTQHFRVATPNGLWRHDCWDYPHSQKRTHLQHGDFG
jgi:hypothetical protein